MAAVTLRSAGYVGGKRSRCGNAPDGDPLCSSLDSAFLQRRTLDRPADLELGPVLALIAARGGARPHKFSCVGVARGAALNRLTTG